MQVNDLGNLKKLIGENKELLNWQHEEHDKSTLLRGICEGDDRVLFIEYLLSCEEIGVDLSDKNGFTACMIASLNNHSSKVSMLLDRGTDIHATDNAGNTACMTASQYGHSSMVSLLLDKGADIHARTNNGYTACMLASQNGHLTIVSMLLDRGADINAKVKRCMNIFPPLTIGNYTHLLSQTLSFTI